MRSIIFRDHISSDRLKKDVMLTQDILHNGTTTRFQKHFTYLINEHSCLRNLVELQAWIQRHAHSAQEVHTFINKSYNRQTGQSSFELKKTGRLYIVRNRDVFVVRFVQSFKINTF